MRSKPESENRSDSRNSIAGVVPVIPTPFQPDTEAIDLEALARLIDFAAALDISAVCLPAYASEFYKLSEAERFQIVEVAVKASGGNVPIVAQSNHPSARQAADIARRNADLGADFISFAIPRLFSVTTEDLLDYCTTVCGAVTLPVLVQDFNPGGPTIDATFCARLQEACPNFRYVKLEEPLMGDKVKAIRDGTKDEVGVLEGWGGMYTLELIPYGICGLMPGLGSADLLARIWRLGKEGQTESALDIFQMVLPQLVFSLQNLELFLHLEKRLLVERGVLRHATVRRATYTPSDLLLAYGNTLNRRVLKALDKYGLPRRPTSL